MCPSELIDYAGQELSAEVLGVAREAARLAAVGGTASERDAHDTRKRALLARMDERLPDDSKAKAKSKAEKQRCNYQLALAEVVRDRITEQEIPGPRVAEALRLRPAETGIVLLGVRPLNVVELWQLAGLLQTTPAELLAAAEAMGEAS